MITSNKKEQTMFIVLMAVFILSACSGLTQSNKPAVTSWWLEPYIGPAKGAVAEPAVTVALTVKAVPGLDSDQVLTLSSDAQLKPYSGARWVDYAPDFLVSLLGRSLEADGRFEVLKERSGRGPENCELQLELREFFADLNSMGRTSGVRLALDGRYQCASATAVEVNSSALVPVGEERMSVIVAAFQRALDQVTQDILAQL
ncbi:MAG: ABC-type transport auxiliary lipoprotein family protein [Lysobacterales bacterium]